MWQKEKKDSSIVGLALLLTLATIPMTATIALESALAQSSPVPSPAVSPIPTGTTVRIDGSRSMAAINQNLKQRFEKQSSGTNVDVAANGTDAALKALQDGKIDLAAISRELTPAEAAQGLKQVLLHREKIAIVVGTNNPFKGSLTSRRFAKIFRGEITDWSQVGGPEGKIRVIDRPATSDTREAFRDYPVFQTANFATGSTALQLDEDSTPEIVKQLGKDGISYVLANQVSKLQGVRILQMNHVLPEDSRYPFSLPSVYVYKKNPAPIVSKFLDHATASAGQQVIEEVRTAEAVAIASGDEPVATAINTSSTTETATSTATASPISPSAEVTNTSTTATASPSATTSPSAEVTNQPTAAHAAHKTSSDHQGFLTASKNVIGEGITPLLWWLLPLFALGGLLLWWVRGRRPSSNGNLVTSTPTLPMEEASATKMPSTTSKTHKHSLSDVAENPTQTTVSNQVADPTPAGSATLADGTVLAIGTSSPLWLKFFDRGSDTEVNNNTTKLNNYTETSPPKSQEVVANGQLGVAKVTAPLKQPQVPIAVDLEAPVTVVNSKYPELPDVPIASNVEPKVSEVATSSAKLPRVPEVASEMVADAVKPTAQKTETEKTNIIGTVSKQPEETTEVASNTAALTGGAVPGTAMNGIKEATELDVKSPINSTDKAAPMVHEEASESVNADFESQIILTPRTPKWAYAFWEVSDHQKQALRQQGGSQLALRLYDVTNIDLSYQSPQQIQQYDCEETIHDRYVAIPTSDRDYMAEIGYVTNNNLWLLLARSAIVRVFSRPDRDFWFVADAELIIHGAVEPGSTVAIDGHTIKLKPDGTFHLRIPFTDRLIDYAMKAVSANEEQAKTIHMQFFQGTPE